MKVILLKDVKGTGKKGEVIEPNNLPPSPAFEYIVTAMSSIFFPNSTAASYSFWALFSFALFFSFNSFTFVLSATTAIFLGNKKFFAYPSLTSLTSPFFPVPFTSLGKINVHVLMEKLGGGGHMDIAGAQLEGVSIQEAYKKVNYIIEQYLREED